MADINLTQEQADLLMAMEKRADDPRYWDFPGPGEKIVVPLTSLDGREVFSLDVTRMRIKLTKCNFIHRARVTIVLYRLDVDGGRHTNPDGEEIPCPHLHVYKEGYGDKWAIPATADMFPDTTNLYATLERFMAYCAIVQPPSIVRGLFS